MLRYLLGIPEEVSMDFITDTGRLKGAAHRVRPDGQPLCDAPVIDRWRPALRADQICGGCEVRHDRLVTWPSRSDMESDALMDYLGAVMS